MCHYFVKIGNPNPCWLRFRLAAGAFLFVLTCPFEKTHILYCFDIVNQYLVSVGKYCICQILVNARCLPTMRYCVLCGTALCLGTCTSQDSQDSKVI